LNKKHRNYTFIKEKVMNSTKFACLALLALTSASAMSAFADNEDSKCAAGACQGDEAITANVKAALKQHSELNTSGELGVQTRNRVVYLSGSVDTGLEKNIAETTAKAVANVDRVVNAISVKKE
jgi:osmotically-inducible protein OsmY